MTRVGLLAIVGAMAWEVMASTAVAPPAPFLASFVDVATTAGLTQPVIYGPSDHADYILETVGSGVALLDYDNDGWLDILVLNGTRFDDAPPGTTNHLYRNNHDGTYRDVTSAAGLVHTGWAAGVTVGDYDNDGFDDIFMTYYPRNVLYHNNGDGTFREVTAEAGLADGRADWGSGATWIDYDRDGYLDLFITNYVDFDRRTVPKPGQGPDCRWKGVAVNCGPRGLPSSHPRLFRNTGKGRFVDVTDASGIAAATGSYALTAVAADFDEDGWPDIFVACDMTPSFLFHNQRDGTFREEAMRRAIAVNEEGRVQAGMGVGLGDVDLDGHLDIFKTHFADDTNGLYRGDGRGSFEEITRPSGIGRERRYTGWGAGIVDLDNDGLPDLFLVTGSAYPEVGRVLPAYPYKTPRVIFRNRGQGRFEELDAAAAGPGIAAAHSSRGCAFGDLDNDGDLDIVIVNLNEPPSLLRNDLPAAHHSLTVQLIGTDSNRDAIGARVTATTAGGRQAQAVTAQTSFLSVNDPRLLFGLGEATTTDLTISWPSGRTDNFPGVAADQLVVVQEKSGIVRHVRRGEGDKARLSAR